MSFFTNIFSKLPAISKTFNTYSALTALLTGMIFGVLVGRFSIIVLLMAMAGVISSHSKLSIHGFNTAYVIPNLAFLIGVIIFSTGANGWVIAIVYITGIILGKGVKQRFQSM